MFLIIACFGLALLLVITSIRIDFLNERVTDLENELDSLKEETRLEIDTLKN